MSEQLKEANALRKIFKQKPFTLSTIEGCDEVLAYVENEMSPEWLTCDGELDERMVLHKAGELNKLKFDAKQARHKLENAFKKGDKVKFSPTMSAPDEIKKLTFTIVKMNPKRIVVADSNGNEYSVTPMGLIKA